MDTITSFIVSRPDVLDGIVWLTVIVLAVIFGNELSLRHARLAAGAGAILLAIAQRPLIGLGFAIVTIAIARASMRSSSQPPRNLWTAAPTAPNGIRGSRDEEAGDAAFTSFISTEAIRAMLATAAMGPIAYVFLGLYRLPSPWRTAVSVFYIAACMAWLAIALASPSVARWLDRRFERGSADHPAPRA